MSPPAAAPILVVLDTNVWLDLLVFEDVQALPLHRALEGGLLTPLLTHDMLAELADVLARPLGARWIFDPHRTWARAAALGRRVSAAAPVAGLVPRCSDPDDQRFIDLAWLWPVRWLISRDRALLDLARPARQRGLDVLTPARWAASWPAPAHATARPGAERA